MSTNFHTGFIAIVGRPNVGKSTLLNVLVGQKISITSKKPQTTRHRITGIRTDEASQLIFVDTPGFQLEHKNALNRAMNKSVTSTLSSVDVVLFVIEALHFDERDKRVMQLLPDSRPVILVINKIDTVEDKGELLPFIDRLSKEFAFAEIVPIAAEKAQIESLPSTIRKYIPEGPPMYEADDVTDRNERFLAAEIIREKIFRLLGEEVPYSASVMIEQFTQEGNLRRIHASVIVDKPGQKAILIGKGGEKMKAISTQARKDMETLFCSKVYLEVWVKIKSGWADDERAVKSLGYGDA